MAVQVPMHAWEKPARETNRRTACGSACWRCGGDHPRVHGVRYCEKCGPVVAKEVQARFRKMHKGKKREYDQRRYAHSKTVTRFDPPEEGA